MNRGTWARRLALGFLAVVLLTLAGWSAFPTPAGVDAADQIVVNNNEAISDFPDGIKFSLDIEGPRPIERIELLYRAASKETLNLQVPDFKPSRHVALSHLTDFRIDFLPAGIDVTYHWRIVDDQGNVTETEPRTVLWLDNRFEWDSVSTENVTVYSYNRNPAFSQFILDTAQETVDRLKDQFGLTELVPIRIWVYNSKKDFDGTRYTNSGEWAVATSYSELQVVAAALPEGGKREVGRVVPHEVSHALLYQATLNPFNGPSTWLDEGIAITSQLNGNEDFLAQVENAAEKGRLLSIRSLNGAYPYDPADAALAYAEYYSIVRFIIDDFGEDKLAAVVAAYREGVTHDQALMNGLGVDIDELDRLWKESLGYEGDQPPASGATGDGSRWTDFIGTGLASGALVLLISLFLVALIRITGGRRPRGTVHYLG